MIERSRCEDKKGDIGSMQEALAESPVPAWTLATFLISRGFFGPKDKLVLGGADIKQTVIRIKPSRVSCFGFGIAHLLGGWIVFDGAKQEGAGFNIAWSSLYVLANSRGNIRSIFKYGRLGPLALTLAAITDVGIYSREFMNRE